MTGFTPHQSTPKPCDQCQHWGGWMVVTVGGEIRMDIHGWCNRARQVVAQPAHGCAHWTGAPDQPMPRDPDRPATVVATPPDRSP